jgi:hypothetical protein
MFDVFEDLFDEVNPGATGVRNSAETMATFRVLVVTLTTTVVRVCTRRRPAGRIASNDERNTAF